MTKAGKQSRQKHKPMEAAKVTVMSMAEMSEEGRIPVSDTGLCNTRDDMRSEWLGSSLTSQWSNGAVRTNI